MSKGKFALGALIGGAIGAVAALLTAPQSGKDTREDIKKKVNDIKSDTEKKATEVKEQAKVVTKDVQDQAEELRKRAENAVQGAKEGFNKNVK
jgi:gas vesicle protein